MFFIPKVGFFDIDDTLIVILNLALQVDEQRESPFEISDLLSSITLVARAGFEPAEGHGFVKCRMSGFGRKWSYVSKSNTKKSRVEGQE